MERTSFFSSLIVVLALGACGTSPAKDADAGVSGDSGVSGDGGATVDAGAPGDGGGALDAAMDGGSSDAGAGGDTTYMLPTGNCFTFSTATAMDAMSMTCGDMQALSGANVDLDSPAGPDSMGGFCPLVGTFTSLSMVPSSYASCAWTSYIEGLDSLADHGFIVRDATHTHHYRMRIVSNALPALVFAFDAID